MGEKVGRKKEIKVQRFPVVVRIKSTAVNMVNVVDCIIVPNFPST